MATTGLLFCSALCCVLCFSPIGISPAQAAPANVVTQAQQGIDPLIKDLIQAISWLVASIGGVIAAFKAIAELRENRLVRAQELRWKQATLAQEFLDKMFSDQQVEDALFMIDWSNRTYQIDKDTSERISSAEVWDALRTGGPKFTPKERYVRDCFDELLYAVERVEHGINNNLFTFMDIQHPLEYYARRIQNKGGKQVVQHFMKEYKYQLAPQFFDRFDCWKELDPRTVTHQTEQPSSPKQEIGQL